MGLYVRTASTLNSAEIAPSNLSDSVELGERVGRQRDETMGIGINH